MTAHTMNHRHINTCEYTLAAIDDVIERGVMNDWLELRDAVRSSSRVANDVRKVCEHGQACSDFASRYVFWRKYLDQYELG